MTGFKVFIIFAMFFMFSLAVAFPTAHLKKIAGRQESTPETCVRCCRLQRNFDRAQSGFSAAEERLEAANEASNTSKAELNAARTSMADKNDQISSLQALRRRNRELMTALQSDIEAAEESSGKASFLRTLLQAVRRDLVEIQRETRTIIRERRRWIPVIETAREGVISSRGMLIDAQGGLNRATRRKQNAQAILQRCLDLAAGPSETTPTSEMPAETPSVMPPVTQPEMPAETPSEMPDEMLDEMPDETLSETTTEPEPEVSPEM